MKLLELILMEKQILFKVTSPPVFNISQVITSYELQEYVNFKFLKENSKFFVEKLRCLFQKCFCYKMIY